MMKRALQVFTILSWVNLIAGLFLVLMGLLGMIATANVAALGFILLTGSIALHSYACLQLLRSLRSPEIPLDSKVPQGINLVGFLALFFGILNLAYSFEMLINTDEMLKLLPAFPEGYQELLVPVLKVFGTLLLLLSTSVVVNVMLSFSLLRWYKQSRQKDE